VTGVSVPGPAAIETGLVGRELQLDHIGKFLRGGPGCLVLLGEPGIGKTAVWANGIATAREAGVAVLSSRASEAETGVSFAALSDLAGAIDDEVLAALPAPQLHALEVAIRRAHPTGGPVDPLAISAGFHGALRAIGESGPLLLAIDDVQWLDGASAEPIAFAIRRLAGCNVRILLTKRSGYRSPLDHAISALRVEEVELPGLSYGALRQLLSERLGLVLPRREFRQLYETCNGNPLFGLEVGRLLIGSGSEAGGNGVHEVGADLPLPRLVEDIFGQRLRELPPDVKLVLLATALSAGLRRGELARVVDPLALEDAISNGLVVVDSVAANAAERRVVQTGAVESSAFESRAVESRVIEAGAYESSNVVRPSHPLLAAAARRDSPASERRDLHLGLASAVSDEVLRARHLALATSSPDNEVAGVVAAASVVASERAALLEAEELAAQALRLTPDDAAERGERLIVLAQRHLDAGDLDRARTLLETRLDEVPPGRARAFARITLGEAGSLYVEERQLELALAEDPDDLEVRSIVSERKAILLAVGRVERLDEAEVLARDGLSTASHLGRAAEARALTVLAWVLALRGRPIDEPIDDLAAQRLQTLPASGLYHGAVERPLGVRHAFRGEVEQARSIFLRLSAEAFSRGELRMSRVINTQLFELAIRCGDATEARRVLEEHEQWSDVAQETVVGRRLRAQLAAVVGDPAAAARWAGGAVDLGESSVEWRWDVLEIGRALGLVALFEGDAASAVQHLLAVWAFTRSQHVDDPGAFPVAGDLVEALVEVGDLDAAGEVVAAIGLSAVEQQHPWAAATAARGGAVVRLAGGGGSGAGGMDEAAAQALRDAAVEFGRLGLDFDAARCLLALGRFERRFRKSGAARRSLEEAAALFDRGGCSGWAALTRSELARVPGRRPGSSTRLTAGELQVATLAAKGHTNKEISAKLFLSVNTVEGHLSKAYSKLGVRSRSQLSNRLADLASSSAPE
jgi:DNA-binding CsgD family transcriptional regulator